MNGWMVIKLFHGQGDGCPYISIVLAKASFGVSLWKKEAVGNESRNYCMQHCSSEHRFDRRSYGRRYMVAHTPYARNNYIQDITHVT